MTAGIPSAPCRFSMMPILSRRGDRSAVLLAPEYTGYKSRPPADIYLNNSGLGSAMKPSRFGIITVGRLAASSTVDLSMIFPSARI